MSAFWKRFAWLALVLAGVWFGLYRAFAPVTVSESEQKQAETLPALTPGQERLPLPPLKRASQSSNTNVEAFRRLANDTLGRLPTNEAFLANPHRETHFTPAELLDAAPLMARLTTELRQNPELIPSGVDFYDRCARQESLMTATRAVCLRDLRHWTQQLPGAAPIDPSQFDH